MKFILIFIMFLSFTQAFDESKQLKTIHPLQERADLQKILQAMQTNIKDYLHETPLSSYNYFNENRSDLNSQALITWIHGDVYLNTLAAGEEPFAKATLNNGQYTHLGDYRYDIFTLLSDLLLKMQEDSDFSGSKEKAILGTFIDGYFERLQNQKLKCPSIDDALGDVKGYNLLIKYTKVHKKSRLFDTRIKTLSKASSTQAKSINMQMSAYLKKFKFLPIKDIAKNSYGDYLLLCEGKTKKLNDDIIFTLSARTVPVSYQVDKEMKKSYLNKSLLHKSKVISSFNQTEYAGSIKINKQNYFVNKLNPSLKLQPQSEKTRSYKNYAAALGYMLASFHSNPALKPCLNFSKKVKREVKTRVVKTEIISMVYAYNETLEENWESFSDKELLSLK